MNTVSPPKFLSLLLASALAFLCLVQPGQTASAGNIQNRIQPFIDDGTIAGSVTLVATAERVVALNAIGKADLASGTAMRPGALFWIASLTKPIVGAAILMLEDEGRLSIEDAVEKHLPEFKGQWMIRERSDTEQVLVPAPRPVTLRDLLTHTSGLSDVSAPRPNSTLAELAMAYSQRPLRFAPGSKWEYSNAGITVLGRIIEIVSGNRFEEFLQTRLLDPLGMRATTFWPTAGQAKRVATSYRQKDGVLEPTPVFVISGNLTDRTRTPLPAMGLYSSAHDLAAFYQMMLQGGRWNGRQLLSSSAVRKMTTTQTGDMRTGFTEGMSWGLGFQVVKQPQGATQVLSEGSFGHGGAYGTQSWADPKRELIYILMIQRAGHPDGDASPVRKAFQEAAAALFNP